jgi:hypothetical protein
LTRAIRRTFASLPTLRNRSLSAPPQDAATARRPSPFLSVPFDTRRGLAPNLAYAIARRALDGTEPMGSDSWDVVHATQHCLDASQTAKLVRATVPEAVPELGALLDKMPAHKRHAAFVRTALGPGWPAHPQALGALADRSQREVVERVFQRAAHRPGKSFEVRTLADRVSSDEAAEALMSSALVPNNAANLDVLVTRLWNEPDLDELIDGAGMFMVLTGGDSVGDRANIELLAKRLDDWEQREK